MRKVAVLILVITALMIVMLGCGNQKTGDVLEDKELTTEELIEGIWEINVEENKVHFAFSNKGVLLASIIEPKNQQDDFIGKWTLENDIIMLKMYWTDEYIGELKIEKVNEKILEIVVDGQIMQLVRKSSSVDTNLTEGMWRADDIIRGSGTERFQDLYGWDIAENLFLDNLKFYNDGTYSGGFYFEYGGELHKSQDLNGTYRIAHDGKALCFNGTTYYEYVCIENRLEMKDASGEVATFTLEQ